MQDNVDRELQIELTKLQVEHENAISVYTIFLSVIFSLMIAVVSVYVPLGVATGNYFYLIFSTAYDSILVIPLYWIMNKMKQTERRLKREIQELKKKYLW